MPNYLDIAQSILNDYSNYIISYQLVKSESGRIKKLRFELINFSIVDIYYSASTGKYSFHYETENEYYRHDNSPHHHSVKTYPKHTHFNESVGESYLPDDIIEAAKEFFNLLKKEFLEP
ncbi:MAG: toxin-antitoxin system TumE family protein [Ignavibacteriaceae bacterium]